MQTSPQGDMDVLTSAFPDFIICDVPPVAATNILKSCAPPSSDCETNNCMVKAHKLLDSIEEQIRTLMRSSSTACSQQLCTNVEGVRRALRDVKRQVDSVTTCKRELARLCDELEGCIIPEEEDNDPIDYDSSHHFKWLIDDYDETAQVSLLIAATSVLVLGVGCRAREFLLQMISLVLGLVFDLVAPWADTLCEHTLVQIPKTIPAALSHFSLEPHTTVYAVCPACSCTYKPQAEMEKYSYPTLCTNVPRPGADVCNATLVKDPEDGAKYPIKSFIYHHFHDYVAALLARPRLENVMDKPCDRLVENLHCQPSLFRDIWDGDFLQTFKGPDDEKLFADRGDEGRLIFSLNIDFFNIEGN
ncbi:hypothetical protein EDD16DRAFT_1706959 [Pisolithus croceorrhizus]|nr:hypothetical protein EDD16DRAFT_1706959 [Pisolithus croceorrhizus]